MNKQRLDDLLQFIKQNRSNEANFEILRQKLDEELASEENTQQFREALESIRQKQIEAYINNKNNSGSAWPEFENFVSAFEKLITEKKNK